MASLRGAVPPLRRSAGLGQRSSALVLSRHHLRNPSNPLQWQSRRTAWSPMDWFKRTMEPKFRGEESKEDVKQAKERLVSSGQASVFEDSLATQIPGREADVKGKQKEKAVQVPSHHKYSTGIISISHRKLNKVAKQVAGKPIDQAILQMTFSEKRVSTRIKSMLVVARNHALEKGIKKDKMIVSEAWVNKGPGGRQHKQLVIHGRGKHGIRTIYKAKMHVMLGEGLTLAEKKQKELDYKVGRIVSAGLNREDKPLRNPAPMWAW